MNQGEHAPLILGVSDWINNKMGLSRKLIHVTMISQFDGYNDADFLKWVEALKTKT